MKQLLYRFTESAARRMLLLSSQEILRDTVIGLDARNRRLLVVDSGEQLIALDDIRECTVKKEYAPIRPGALSGRRLDAFLRRISLRLEFKSRPGCEIVFYNVKADGRDAVPFEKRARRWAESIRQLLGGPQAA
ncbi:hypothetical protein EPD60_06965 [Flaviaesturariibacter flavus]|uniref:Uncharacterized protein n=1 Tax=Flaviaesturariibacter flavus TaxID=2502780 RepID=A0A4R1BIB0_9BACT|nr:hypothetical protein [Flaviaesturariibacter flavus]TCJ17045.1 hypothetical protein EPD60_06965 [Flaviaesturariibacter flavus]